MNPSKASTPASTAEAVLGNISDPARLSALAARLRPALGSRFEVLDPIALGGMATIFRLEHTLHRGVFVAKVLHPELASRIEVVSSFRNEAVHAARLGGHPNAVPVFDFGVADDLHFMVLPFVEGEDLDRLLQSHGPLSRDEALACAAQISSLLCYAESHGITHCDLAPGNIRLDIFGRYRVLDLGISHCATAGTPFEALGGTPLYTSPEQVRGETPDIRSDLYSLGAILVELLTGKPLLQADSLEELKQKHLRGDWQLPPLIQADPLLAQLLTGILATDRSQRLPSAFELSGALDALGFPRPEFRRPFSATRTSTTTGRRQRLSPG